MLQRENTKIFFEAFSAIIAMKIEVNLFDSKTIAMDEVRVLISHPSILPFTFVKLETFFPLVSLSFFHVITTLLFFHFLGEKTEKTWKASQSLGNTTNISAALHRPRYSSARALLKSSAPCSRRSVTTSKWWWRKTNWKFSHSFFAASLEWCDELGKFAEQRVKVVKKNKDETCSSIISLSLSPTCTKIFYRK